MNSATVAPPTDWKETRRLPAWELVQQGWKQQDVAAALGVPGRGASGPAKPVRKASQPCARNSGPPQSGCWPSLRCCAPAPGKWVMFSGPFTCQ